MKLYTYFRSTAAYRVRIVLNYKELDYEPVYVNLKEGEQTSQQFLDVNPQGLVPVLEHDGQRITQSGAIIAHLGEVYPEPSLVPSTLQGRDIAREIALLVVNDIHPLNNLRVLKYLENELKVDEKARQAWYHHWVHAGFGALEKILQRSAGQYCIGDEVSIADTCLVPQVYNAQRFKADLAGYPNILRINTNCLKLSAFDLARPEKQEDCPQELRMSA